MVVFDCRHPGCGKTFHSSDAVRKHARKQHPFWLRRIDEEASLTRLMHRTEQYSAKRTVLRSEHEASQRAVDSDDSDEEPPERKPERKTEKKPPRAPAARPKLAPPPRPSMIGGRPSQEGASPRDDKKPPPSARSHKKQQEEAKEAESDEEVEAKATEVEPAEDLSAYTQPSCRWNSRRSAYDAILPHGEGWSIQQIEWFVGLWWTHLANASVSVFHGSLEQFSAWAAAPAGLECLVAWLKRMPELGEDLLLLQLLELLEYADLTPLALLPELTELVRALKTYSDKDVAETAERVVVLLEELQTAESITREDRRRAKEKQRSDRLHLRAVKAADQASARAAKGGKRKGPAAPARSQQRQRREKDVVVVEEEGEEEEEEEEEEGEEEEESEEEVEEACFCGTQRHRYDNNLPFDGVWVQCEGCLRWCHGECVGMTAQQAKYAESYTCKICTEASESSEDSSAGCSDFASDAAASDADSDGSGLQFRRPGGAANGGSERKEKEEKERKQKKERREARKEKRRVKAEARKARLLSQPPSGGKPRMARALQSRGFRLPGLCKTGEGRPQGGSKLKERDGAPGSGRAPKPRGRSVSPPLQCQKSKNCTRGFRHPGLCRLSDAGYSSLVDAQPEYCQKHPLCLRGHRHPGLCRLAPQPSSSSPEPTPQYCQKSIHCVRRFRHPGLCKLNVEANGGGGVAHEAGGCAGIHPSFAAARRPPEPPFMSEHARASSEHLDQPPRSSTSISHHLMFDSPREYAAEVAAAVMDPYRPDPAAYQPQHANPYGYAACNAALAGNGSYGTVSYALMPPGYDAGYAGFPSSQPVNPAWAAPHTQWAPVPYPDMTPGGSRRPSLMSQQRVP